MEPLRLRSPDRSVPGRQDYAKTGLTVDHAFVAFGRTFEREDFGHRAHADHHRAEGETGSADYAMAVHGRDDDEGDHRAHPQELIVA